MFLENQLLSFLKKYNPNQWKESVEGNSSSYYIGDACDSTPSEVEQQIDQDLEPEAEAPNPFEEMTLNEEEGFQNFDVAFLEKGSNEWNCRVSHVSVCLLDRPELQITGAIGDGKSPVVSRPMHILFSLLWFLTIRCSD